MSTTPPEPAAASQSPADDDGKDADEMCVVCCKSIPVYSIGTCGHFVCYECSTRMRVICRQHECPICRRNLPQVIFSNEKVQYDDLRPPYGERFHGIKFMTRGIRDMYYKLLEQVCKKCNTKFKNFQDLRDHMRLEHQKFFCDLCVKHLLIFSFERKCYTRTELGIHRRLGDPDNTSHRGHPRCEFCDQRYMDNDHLFRHLRRDHLFCHLCDADGTYQYYSTYSELRTHFDEAHFLCQIGACEEDMLTAVFRTEIDLKAHVARVHGKQLGRAGTKQARTLEVEFNFTRRNNHDPSNENVDSDGRDMRAGHGDEGEPLFGPPRLAHAHMPLTPADFPSLTGALDEAAALPARTTTASVTVTSNSRPRFNAEEFPSLGGGSSGSAATPASVAAPSTGAVPRTSRVGLKSATRFNSNRGNLEMNLQNFPSLWENSGGNNSHPPPRSGTSVVKLTVQQRPAETATSRPSRETPASSTSIQVRPRSLHSEAFPALGGGSTSSCSSNVPEVRQWVQPKPKKQPEPKVSKVAKPPVLPPSSLADFPSLDPPRKTEKKSSSVTVPITDNGRSDNANSLPGSSTNSAKAGGGKNKNNDGGNSKSKKKDAKSNGTVMTSTLQIGELVGCSSGGNTGNKTEEEEAGSAQAGGKANGAGGCSGNKGGSSGRGGKGGGAGSAGGKSGTTGGKSNAASSKGGATNAHNSGKGGANGSGKEHGGGTRNGRAGQNDDDDWPPISGTSARVNRPPPGFASNDLTFTNSSGQSYSISPPGLTYNYYPPPNFHTRNAALIQRIVYSLHTQVVVDEFKAMSLLYREGKYSPAEYYTLCIALLGVDFEKLFPELLILLPNIDRQAALFREHVLNSKSCNMDLCVICRQVVFTSEMDHHLGAHFVSTEQA